MFKVPKKNDKPVFIISVAAELCEMHPQTLRMYERKGLVCPKRAKHRRLYSEADIERLRLIQSLTQDEGVNLAGVKMIIDMRAELEEAMATVKALESNLERMRSEMLAKFEIAMKRNSVQLEKVVGGALIRFEPRKDRH